MHHKLYPLRIALPIAVPNHQKMSNCEPLPQYQAKRPGPKRAVCDEMSTFVSATALKASYALVAARLTEPEEVNHCTSEACDWPQAVT